MVLPTRTRSVSYWSGCSFGISDRIQHRGGWRGPSAGKLCAQQSKLSQRGQSLGVKCLGTGRGTKPDGATTALDLGVPSLVKDGLFTHKTLAGGRFMAVTFAVIHSISFVSYSAFRKISWLGMPRHLALPASSFYLPTPAKEAQSSWFRGSVFPSPFSGAGGSVRGQVTPIHWFAAFTRSASADQSAIEKSEPCAFS